MTAKKYLPEDFVKEFTALREVTERIETKIFGNGQPGLSEVCVRNQEKIISLSETEAHTVALLVKIEKNLSTHEALPHTADRLLLQKNVITYFVLGFLFLHSIIPPSLNIWELIRKLFGF